MVQLYRVVLVYPGQYGLDLGGCITLKLQTGGGMYIYSSSSNKLCD